MGHQVVYYCKPGADGGQVHLEEARIQQQFKGLLFPGLARVLVAANAGQELGARP